MRCAVLIASFVAVALSQTPPCYNAAAPTLETICGTVVSSNPPYAVVDLGLTVNAAVINGFGASANFTEATAFATKDVLEYVAGINNELKKIDSTAPLIFRPIGNVAWSASFPLPTSVYPDPFRAPRPLDRRVQIEPFEGKRLAAYQFNSNDVATADEYTAATQKLQAYITAQKLVTVPGPWEVAWVTYSPLAVKTNRVNAVWIQVL